jgi:uncharacterized phage infection (PIP) family protein YhgE
VTNWIPTLVTVAIVALGFAVVWGQLTQKLKDIAKTVNEQSTANKERDETLRRMEKSITTLETLQSVAQGQFSVFSSLATRIESGLASMQVIEKRLTGGVGYAPIGGSKGPRE